MTTILLILAAWATLAVTVTTVLCALLLARSRQRPGVKTAIRLSPSSPTEVASAIQRTQRDAALLGGLR